ncbi:chromatin modification-related protein yng2 [Anaeramoeba flamelloides]|uniref:Chromatin modification-related protein yng2 n=1 Tax=Anaeramoeba flamelloides TaxID=1746091 RepID=A0ABQ8Z3M8_9EUKA|nr:chromatin modification-related protein yng2 [Anaeramoeba flamelloides]
MNGYWSVESLQAEDQNVQIKALHTMKYLGFLVTEPVVEELVIVPKGVVHPLIEMATAEEVSSDYDTDEDEKVWCCGKELDEDWIKCDYPKCKVGWYHFSCAGITKEPTGKWNCDSCQKIINEKMRIYEEQITRKKIKTIKRGQRTKLPLWMATQYKSLKLAIFKIPFHFTEKFRNRCREDFDFQQNLSVKCQYWYSSGTILAKAANDPLISKEFSLIFTLRLISGNENAKDQEKEHGNENAKEKENENENENEKEKEKEKEKKIDKINDLSNNNNPTDKNISKTMEKENINNSKQAIGNQIDIEIIQEKANLFDNKESNITQSNKRKFDELTTNQLISGSRSGSESGNKKQNLQTNTQPNEDGSNITEEMDLKKRRQIQKLPKNNQDSKDKNSNKNANKNTTKSKEKIKGKDNMDNQNTSLNKNHQDDVKSKIQNFQGGINSITKLLKEKLITKRNHSFENFVLWNNSQQQKEQLMKQFENMLQLSKEEETFVNKLSQLEKNIYRSRRVNADRFKNWVLKFKK